MASKRVVVKNLPNDFNAEEKLDFVKHFGAQRAYLSRKTDRLVYAEFNHDLEAEHFLKTLHQTNVAGQRIKVEYSEKPSDTVPPVAPPKSATTEISSSYFKNLVALNEKLNFQQPPLPYLCYKYPRADRDIIETIGVALESIPKFYTQVLHLMNRMNLPPPFDVQNRLKKTRCDAGTQTDISVAFGSLDASEEESELETEGESGVVPSNIIPEQRKRKNPINLKNPYKKFRNSMVTGAVATTVQPVLATRKIEILMPDFLRPPPPINRPIVVEQPALDTATTSTFVTQLADNQLSPEEMAKLPVFKDYHPGQPTSKLYIKNLAKTVTDDDLHQLYDRYKRPHDSVEVKLMQSGRMKGQAFIQFQTSDVMEPIECLLAVVERARRETNAFILKDKPMVVVFGKASAKNEPAN